MTKDEALKMAIEAMNSAYSSHGKILPSYPAQDAWLYHGCDSKLFKALQACKEALEQQTMTYEQGFAHGYEAHRVEQENDKQESIVSLWDALTDEQPAQEPIHNCPNCNSLFTKEIYSTPAPSWQGLSDDEICKLSLYNDVVMAEPFARAIEQALRNKNART